MVGCFFRIKRKQQLLCTSIGHSMNPYELVETSVGCKIISSIFAIFLLLLCHDIMTPIVSRTVNRTPSQVNATLVTVSKRRNDNAENIVDIYSKINKISRLRLVPTGIIATRMVRWPRKLPNHALSTGCTHPVHQRLCESARFHNPR